jgi:hypothetical protein
MGKLRGAVVNKDDVKSTLSRGRLGSDGMLFDPLVGLIVIHEFTRFAPGAESPRREIQIIRPFKNAPFRRDFYALKKPLVSQRLKDGSAANERRQIDVRDESVRERDAQNISAKGLNCGDSLAEVLVHNLIEWFNSTRLRARPKNIPRSKKFLSVSRSPIAHHHKRPRLNSSLKHSKSRNADGNRTPLVTGVEVRNAVIVWPHGNLDSVKLAKLRHSVRSGLPSAFAGKASIYYETPLLSTRLANTSRIQNCPDPRAMEC